MLRLQQKDRAFRDACVGLLLAVVHVACRDEFSDPGVTAPESRVGSLAAATSPVASNASQGDVGVQSLVLPFAGSATSTSPALSVTQKGGGHAGRFENTSTQGVRAAMWAQSNNGGAAVVGLTTGTSNAGYFQVGNSSSRAAAVHAVTNAGAAAIYGENMSHGPSGFFAINARSNRANALEARTNGDGIAVEGTNYGNGPGAQFGSQNSAGDADGLRAYATGTGAGMRVWNSKAGPSFVAEHFGHAGPLALFRASGVNKIRFDKSGKGFFNGGTQTGGADVAEAFEVEGHSSDYKPGDVLAISASSNRRVEKSQGAYSTLVIGVYATEPGVLLTERDVDDALDGMVPVGVLGVIPTRVSGENGAIRRGDLLVTARRPGHAMRGTARERMFGATVGKALEPFVGPGVGVINVLVNVK